MIIELHSRKELEMLPLETRLNADLIFITAENDGCFVIIKNRIRPVYAAELIYANELGDDCDAVRKMHKEAKCKQS